MVSPIYCPKVGDHVDDLDTPSMIVDLNLMEANIEQLMGRLQPKGVSIRPHLKTTKSVALARRLVAAGCTGGCVAKLGEAEVLCAGGFNDLLITSEIVSPIKVKRLVELYKNHKRVRIVVDNIAGAGAINEALEAAGVVEPIKTLIDLNVGLDRTGVSGSEAAIALARHIADLKCMRIIGVQGYEGHLQHIRSKSEREMRCRESMKILVSTAKDLQTAGFDVQVVSTGGTGTAEICASVHGVTEVQPGSFIFMDTDYHSVEGLAAYSNSLTIIATVLSKQGDQAATIDTGLKSLTTDSGLARCKDSRYEYKHLGDEHGSLSWGKDTAPLSIGDRVEMIPSHIDPTINLHEYYYAHRGGVIEEIWKVDTRGKVQ